MRCDDSGSSPGKLADGGHESADRNLEVPFFFIALFDVPTVDLGENPPVRSDGHVEEQSCLSSAAAGPWPDEDGQVGEAAAGASDNELGVVTGARGPSSVLSSAAATSCLSSAAAGPWPDEVGLVDEAAVGASDDEFIVVTGACS